jgi:CDP-diacylglycerol---serine O-phosphatidyltransferase
MWSKGRDWLPSACTFGGLLLAFAAMTLIQEGRYETAVWVLFVAACVDVADGALARALDATTPFGRQLDSLADLVAAGVAPAFLVHEVYFSSWGIAGVLVAGSWAALVAARLARFNTTTNPDRFHFVGVPCPIAATLLCQYLLFCRATWDNNGSAWVCAGLVVALGLLMLSRVPYWSSATMLPGQFFRHPFGPGAATMALLCIPFPQQAIFVTLVISMIGAVTIYTVRQPRFTGPVVAPHAS